MADIASAVPDACAVRAASLTQAAMVAPSGPWWRHPMMWLVVGGPSVVVVASFITLTLAIRHGDPVVEHGNQAGSAHVSAEDAGTEEGARALTASRTGFSGQTAQAGRGGQTAGASGDDSMATDPALQPAMRARNHAATGGKER